MRIGRQPNRQGALLNNLGMCELETGRQVDDCAALSKRYTGRSAAIR